MFKYKLQLIKSKNLHVYNIGWRFYFNIFIISIVLTPSCTLPEKEIGNQLIVKNAISNILLEELVDSVVFIPIENHPSVIIGHIDKIIAVDSLLFIGDFEVTKEITVCNSRGEFIAKVGATGRGPESFEQLYDFDVFSDTLFILASNKILKYSLHGDYLSEQRLSFFPERFAVFNDHSYIFYNSNTPFDGRNRYCLSVLSKSLEIIDQRIPYEEDETVNQYMLKKPLIESKNCQYISRAFSFEITSYCTNGFHTIKFELPDQIDFEEWIDFDYPKDLMHHAYNSNKIWAFDNVVVNSEWILYSAYKGSAVECYAFDISRDGNYKLKFSVWEDMWYPLLQASSLWNRDNQYLYGAIEFMEFKYLIEEDRNGFYQNRFLGSKDVLSMDDGNQVIVKFNLRK